MPGFINSTQNISIEQITDLANVSSVPDFFIKINTVVYGGYLWFIVLWVLWVILYRSAQQRNDQPLNNAMYSGAIISIGSFLLRGLVIVREGGIIEGFLTDHQLWVFPIITAVLAVIIWSIKD